MRASSTLVVAVLSALGTSAVAQSPTEPAADDPVEITARPGKGVTFSTGDAFAMTVRGRLMLRYTYLHHDASNQQELTVRRARLYVQGHTYSKPLQYYFHAAFAQQDFDQTATNTLSNLYDAYLQLTYLRDLHVRVGQQLVPFGRARVISSQNAELVDRSPVVAELNLDRDVGIKLFSSNLGGLDDLLGYEAFVGVGDGRNQTLGKMGLLYVGRVQVNPMGKFADYTEADIERTQTPKLSIGLGAAYEQDTARVRGTTGARETLAGFDYSYAAADALFKYAGLAVEAEWMLRRATADVRQQTDPMTGMLREEYSRSAHGYFIQVGYVFSRHDLGVAARYAQMFTLRDGTDPALKKTLSDQGKELVYGLNWFIHGHVLKLQADYSYLFGDDASAGRSQVRVQMHVGY